MTVAPNDETGCNNITMYSPPNHSYAMIRRKEILQPEQNMPLSQEKHRGKD